MSAAEQIVMDDARAARLLAVCELALSLSDVDFLRWLDSERPLTVEAPGAKELIDLELPYYAFSESEQTYRAHYAKYEGEFFAGPVRSFVAQDWRRDPRYVAIANALSLVPGVRHVLDYGCSTGHITRQLAMQHPNVQFVGIDITPAAVEWFNNLAPPNARAVVAIHEYNGCECTSFTNIGNNFDVIICAEVLEHVRDPYAVIDHLSEHHLRDGGAFLCTLPFGPWESRGWSKEDPHAREHLRHWGAAELRDVFGNDTLAWHVGSPDLGNTITLSGPRVGTVDMASKLARYVRAVGG